MIPFLYIFIFEYILGYIQTKTKETIWVGRPDILNN